MCGIAEASLAATVLGGVTSAYGQIQQGKAAKSQADYEAAIQRNNAIRADFLAEDAIERGKINEQQQRLRGRLLIGQMRAVLASSGQVIDEGSAGQLIEDQAGISELDALNVRNIAKREAQGFRIQSTNFESSANLTRLSGESARRASRTAAAGTLLSSGGKVASKWYQFEREGAFD